MKLRFIGTRGYIDERSPRHRRHTATVVSHRGRHVMIDCGLDWANRVFDIAPPAIVLTHGHPDHAYGLAGGAPCPVYATAETWANVDAFPIARSLRRTITPRRRREIQGIGFEAFPVEHSLNCPAVGYRITAGRSTVFYVPDVVHIHDRTDALRDVDVYIGDGATLDRPMVRKQHGRLTGHTTVRAQLGWCENEGVPRVVVTHCGRDIVGGDERRIGPRVRRWGRERGVGVQIAHDGMELTLP